MSDFIQNKIEKEINMGLVTPMLLKSGVNPTLNLVKILNSFTDKFYIIEIDAEGNLPNTFKDYSKKYNHRIIYHDYGSSGIKRIVNYIITEVKISCELFKMSKSLDTWIFYGEHSPLPMLSAKLIGKEIVLATAANPSKILKNKNDKYYKIISVFSNLNYSLSDKIIVYSSNLISEWNLENYENKIMIAHEHLIDLETFVVDNEFEKRSNLIGYIGRLSDEKGCFNFVQSIPNILENLHNISIIIGGDGKLKNKIQEYLISNNLNDKVELLGWISHDELPKYLSQLKLLVVPSYTEGLPNIILESMACGTPVVATSVGAIPDIIKNDMTGFIIKNNSPECISTNVIQIMNNSNLKQISENARKMVERNFTYKATVKKYKSALEIA